MNVELLIYVYGAICVSMIVFNCVCIFTFKRRDDRLDKKSRKLDEQIEIQLKFITEEQSVEESHIRWLNRELSHIGKLMAFDESVAHLRERDEQLLERYLMEIRPVFLYLSVVYLKKETEQSAYFAYILAKYKICCQMPFDALIDVMEEYLKKDSLYCRQNAMKALYSFGDPEYVVKGIKILEQHEGFFHTKILADGLLTFEGDHERLIALIWKSFDKFKVEIQVALLNYIRFRTGDCCERMLAILTDKSYDRELHFAAIRYLGKYHYPPALPVLLEFAADADGRNWNYAAFSASALAAYPCEQTFEVLKKALTSSNWYIRYNAAQSIDLLGVNYQDVIDIVSGGDRYAREMLMYRFDSRELKEQEKEVPQC